VKKPQRKSLVTAATTKQQTDCATGGGAVTKRPRPLGHSQRQKC